MAEDETAANSGTTAADSSTAVVDSGTTVAIPILKVLKTYSYRIPTFPALTVRLKHLKYQVSDGNTVCVYNGFIRECPLLDRVYPVQAITTGYPDAFCITESEFSQSLGVSNLSLRNHEVLIIWKWTWEEDDEEAEVTAPSEQDDNSDSLPSDAEAESHSLVFKCVGSTKDRIYQDVLKMAAELEDKGKNVPVRVHHEPDKPMDSKAIAFECHIENEWKVIGYVVREALDALHKALETKAITEIKFEWIKYIVHWSKSGPGWYAGVRMTKKGLWPKEVVGCASTL